MNILGVKKETLNNFGAVSEEVVKEMVKGALNKSGAQIGVAISGIAGPGGGSEQRPVGSVCIAWLLEGKEIVSSTEHFLGNRNEVRWASVECALVHSIRLIKEN
jgi:nicotinamide-nucleotide amidase